MLFFPAVSISCGGGGASSGEEPVTSRPVLNLSEEIINENISKYDTSEYSYNWGLDAIGTKESYSILEGNNLSIAGDNIRIAVLDGGYVDGNHADLAANILSTNSENVTNHATHIAGIIAAENNGKGGHGIAYNASIVSIGANYESNLGFDSLVANDVDIANLSWGLEFPERDKEALKSIISNSLAVDPNMLLVAATGNESEAEASYPAQFAADSSLQGSIIAVTSIDQNNNISDFANNCGQAKDYCLSAPGENIYSTISGNNYAELSGTSMAAPHVTGAAGVLKGAWSYLSGKEISEILLDTAIKVDEQGNLLTNQDENYSNEVYGKGILNLQNALMAQGDYQITSANHISDRQYGYDLQITSLNLGEVFGDQIGERISFALQDMVFFDKYNRPFKANIEGKINAKYLPARNSLVNYFKRRRKRRRVVTGNKNLFLGYDPDQEASDFVKRFSLRHNDLDNRKISLGQMHFSFNRRTSLGKLSLSVNNNVINKNIVVNKYYTLQGRHHKSPILRFATNSQEFSPSVSLSKKISNSLKISSYANFYDIGKETKNSNLGAGAFYDNAKSKIEFNIGAIKEAKNKMLNSDVSGAFGMKNDQMIHMDLSYQRNITNKITLSSNLFFSKTKVGGIDNGIIEKVSDIYSREFTVNLTKETKNHKYGISYTEPLKIISGKMKLNYATGRDASGNIARYSTDVSLAPKFQEKDYEVFFSKYLKNSQLDFNLLYKVNEGHSKNIGNSASFVVKYSKEF